MSCSKTHVLALYFYAFLLSFYAVLLSFYAFLLSLRLFKMTFFMQNTRTIIFHVVEAQSVDRVLEAKSDRNGDRTFVEHSNEKSNYSTFTINFLAVQIEYFSDTLFSVLFRVCMSCSKTHVFALYFYAFLLPFYAVLQFDCLSMPFYCLCGCSK